MTSPAPASANRSTGVAPSEGGPPPAPATVRRPRAWPYALPAFIALVLVLVYPLGYAGWLSVHVDRLSPQDGDFVWFQNYIDVLRQGDLLSTVGRTLIFTFGSLVLQFVVGFAAALALESFPRASRIVRPLLMAPWVIPGVAVAAIWLSILNPLAGFANALLDVVGIDPVQWLSTPAMAMGSLIVVNTWKAAPYWTLMISAGLQTVPRELLEAARVDGASAVRVLWSVIIPVLRPVLGTTALLAFIWTFNYFDLVYLLTNGGPGDSTTTLPFAIWQSSLKFNRFDQAAVYSVLSIAFTGVAIAAYFRVRKRAER